MGSPSIHCAYWRRLSIFLLTEVSSTNQQTSSTKPTVDKSGLGTASNKPTVDSVFLSTTASNLPKDKIQNGIRWFRIEEHSTTASTLLLDRASLCERNFFRRIVRGGLRWSHSVFDFCGHGHESLFDVGGIFRTGLKKWYAKGICELLKRKIAISLVYHWYI